MISPLARFVSLLALSCQGPAPETAPLSTAEITPESASVPRTLMLSGRVELSHSARANQKLLVVTTGEGVAEPARARPDLHGRFQIEVQATEGQIGLGLWSRHLYLEEPFHADPSSADNVVLPAKLGTWVTVRVTQEGGWPEDDFDQAEIQLHALAGDDVLRRGLRQRRAEPAMGLPTYEFRGVPATVPLHARLRTPGFPDQVIEFPKLFHGGQPFLLPGAHRVLSMHVSQGVRFSGRVVDTDGRGIPNATLGVSPFFYHAGIELPGTSGSPVSARTDEQGRFDELFKVSGQLTMSATAEGFRSGSWGAIEATNLLGSGHRTLIVEDGGSVNDIELRILRLPSIAGRLLMPDGRPASGATVFSGIQVEDGRAWNPAPMSASIVAEDGSFTLAGWSSKRSYRIYSAVYEDGRLFQLQRTVLAGDREELLLQLQPQLTPAIRVVAPNGEPVTRYTVGYSAENEVLGSLETVNDDGRFELIGLDATPFTLSVNADGFERSEPWKIDPTELSQPKTIVLLPEAKLHCEVLDAEGQLAPDAAVYLVPADQEKIYAANGVRRKVTWGRKNGRWFTFPVVSTGAYRVWAESPGHTRSAIAEVTLGPNETWKDIVLRLQHPRTVSGRFHPGGEVPQNRRVTLRSEESGRVHHQSLTRTSSFAFEGLPPDAYVLYTDWQSGAPKTLQRLEVEEGLDLQLLFGDPEKDRYSATLKLTYGGEPLANATCRMITKDDGQELLAQTDAQGHAVFHPATRGNADLFLRLDEFGVEVPSSWFLPPAEDYIGVVNAFPGEPHPVQEVDIPTGVVRGRVVLAGGEPVADLDLRFYGQHGRHRVSSSRIVRTGSNGEFLFAGVSGDTCRIDIWEDRKRGVHYRVFEGLEVGTSDPDSCEHELRLAP